MSTLPPVARHRSLRRVLLLALAVGVAAPTTAGDRTEPAEPAIAFAALSGEDTATAAHWIARWPEAKRVALDPSGVAAHNARMRDADPALRDLGDLPMTWSRADVLAVIESISRRPSAPRFDAEGRPLDNARWSAWTDALALDAIDDVAPLRFALVTRRSDLRTFPTVERVFAAPGGTDLDRFQESALFPGTPVAVLHASRDGDWAFVLAETYAAWLRSDALALAPREAVLDYAARATRVITAATARLATTPEAPALSGLVLDMGTRLPERVDWPAGIAVNGQGTLGSVVVEVPTRDGEGRLVLAPALLPRHEASHDGPLPASRANVLRQAFRFLGERYGWGHANGARDCSGFVSEVYRSVGLVLPRNTGDQARSPALAREPLDGLDRDQRLAAVARLAPGDLLYLPGHVVMVVGHDASGPWVIHDVHRLRTREGSGILREWPANGVVVTPLLALWFDEERDYLDAATVLARVLP